MSRGGVVAAFLPVEYSDRVPVPRQVSLLALVVLAVMAQPPERIRKTGQMRVGPHCTVDLDEGDQQCMIVLDGDGSEYPGYPRNVSADFRVEPGDLRLYLRPVHGTLFAAPTSASVGCKAVWPRLIRRGACAWTLSRQACIFALEPARRVAPKSG